MKTVLYIGNNDTSKIFNETAEKADAEIHSRYAENLDSNKIFSLLSGSKYHAVIINSNEIPKAIDNLDNLLHKIVEEYDDTKLCLMCPGAKTNSPDIAKALNAGVQYIMPYSQEKGKIHVFKLLINDDSRSNIEELFSKKPRKKETKSTNAVVEQKPVVQTTTNKKVNEKQEVSQNESQPKPKFADIVKSENKQPTTISVGGSIQRMGTTLVSIQILKTLAEDGSKVCYVDSTKDNNYLKCLSVLYCDNINKDLFNNRFTLAEIDFYYEVSRNILDYIMAQHYDYILYDFGNLYENEIKTNIFLKMDVKILCCGAKCNEYGNALKMLNRFENEDVKFIFNLVPESFVNVVKEMFATTKHKDCYFMPYIESEFWVNSKTLLTIGKIFDIHNKQELLKNKKEFEKQQKENKQ